MSDLVNFLRQRLNEDEQAAPDAEEYWDPGAHSPSEIPHAGRWAPARVLREIRAKRAIIAECPASGATGNDLAEALGGLVLAHLAQPYAGHPEFREEWRV